MSATTTREELTLRSPIVRPVTREMFPLNQPVVIEAIIDTQSGWDFDAPLHIIAPFHRYCETGSISQYAVESKIEDIMIDLDCGIAIQADDSAWPYTSEYLKRVMRDVRQGKRLNRFRYYRSTVVVTAWGDDFGDIKFVQYTVQTEAV